MNPTKLFDLSGRVVIVTGGNGGIGRSLHCRKSRAGWFVTDMTAPVRSPELKEMNDEIMLRTPAGRWGEPDELIGTAIFLASPASDFVTGTLIPVDGGYSIR